MEFETFYDEIKDMGGVFRITIDSKLVKFMGLQVGDPVKVMIKKVKPLNKEDKKEEE